MSGSLNIRACSLKVKRGAHNSGSAGSIPARPTNQGKAMKQYPTLPEELNNFLIQWRTEDGDFYQSSCTEKEYLAVVSNLVRDPYVVYWRSIKIF